MKIDKKYIPIIAIISIVILIIAYVIYCKFIKAKPITDEEAKKAIADVNKTLTQPKIQIGAIAIKPSNFPLMLGSKGIEVKQVQMAINRLKPEANLTADGNLGAKTRLALIQYFGTRFSPMSEIEFRELMNMLLPK